MVEYSNVPASESEIASEYTEEGYNSGARHPQESYEDLQNKGFDSKTIKRVEDENKKMPATSPALVRKKFLKKLFLQYISKYISNTKKYIDHPKQIKNLPSWFDDAIILFGESEITKEQKKMLREFFYGLIQYRDDKVIRGDMAGEVDTTEPNRQLGLRSPYAYNDENIEEVSFPREKEMNRINVMDIARTVASNKQPVESTIEEEFIKPEAGYLLESQPLVQSNKTDIGSLSMKNVTNGGLNDYIMPFGNRKPIAPVPSINIPSQPQQIPTQQTPQNVVPQRSSGMNLTNFIINRRKPPVASQPFIQPTSQPFQLTSQPNLTARKSKKVNPKINRKKVQLANKLKISLSGKFCNPNDLLCNKKMTSVGKIALGTTKNKGKITGLQSVRNMDAVFATIKNNSKQNFGRSNMKMKIVSDIKEQCDKAFKNNKFKMEAINMKKNFFNDIQGAYPKMKMDIASMGDIKENNMLNKATYDIPRIIKSGGVIRSAKISRGSLTPESIGKMDYDFQIGNWGNKKKKRHMDEEIFYEDI